MPVSPNEIIIDLGRDALLAPHAIETLQDRYMVEGETSPQHAFARAAAAFADDVAHAQRLYDYASKGYFMFATPLLSNGGTERGLPISCFLNYMADSREGINQHYEETSWLSSLGGGVGGYIGVRGPEGTSKGSASSGGIPFVCVLDRYMLAFSQGKCYLPGTRVLTETGFKDFRDLKAGERVAQVNDDRSMSFVEPLDIIQLPHKGKMYRFHSDNGAVDVHVTDNHGMVLERMTKVTGRKTLSGKLIKVPADTVRFHRDNVVHLAPVGPEGSEDTLTPFERFLIAFQADGSESRPMACDGSISGCLPYMFHFSKERKIARLRSIVEENAFEYSETIQNDGTTQFYVKVPLTKRVSKTFDWLDFSKWSAAKATAFLDEVEQWDSHRPAGRNLFIYNTTVEANASAVLAVAMIAGRRARYQVVERDETRADRYDVFVRDDYTAFGGENIHTESYDYDGEVYCVEVPSGMIVVEYAGSPMVCGNTRRGSYAAYLDISHPEIDEFLEIRKPSGGDANRKALNLHHAVNIPDAFMHACITDADWNLVSPKTGEVKKTVKARALMRKIVETRHQTGEPFILFSDTANRALPEPAKKAGLRINHSNLCTEIMLPTTKDRTAVCCLSSVNGAAYDEWKDDPLFIEDLLRMLDNTLDDFIGRAPKELWRAVDSARDERSVGLGLMGLHTFFQDHGIVWGSDLARGWNVMIFEDVRKKADAASLKLGAERGEAPLMTGTGERFTHKMAVAPNASSSIFVPGGPISPSIEQWPENIFIHKTLTGAHTVRNPSLERLLESKGQNTKAVWKDILLHEGSVQHLSFLTDHEKNVFKTAFETDQRLTIQMANDRAGFVDQGVSLNLSVPAYVDADYFLDLHFMAWAGGSKSLYYVRSKTPKKAENMNTQVAAMELVVPQDDECLACQG